MVTRITLENQPEYAIRGVVVERASQRGVRGARVEAWDRDTRYHDLLGQVVTDEEGRFTIGFDTVFFGDYAPDRSPDVFFKVYLDGREVLSTFEQPAVNVARGTRDVRLELDLAQAPAGGRDRISAEQAQKAVDWWRASDFRGAAREGGDKLRTVGRLFGGLAGSSLANFDWEPVRPRGTREKEVVGQDVQNAQRALALQQVEVTEVKTVSGGTRDNLRLLKDYPATLKAGDRVTLYEEDGVVKYYTRVPAPDAATVDAAAVARIDGDVQALKTQVRGVDALRTEVDNLKGADGSMEQRLAETTATVRAREEELARLERELHEVRRAAAAKDAELVQLRTDLAVVRAATDALSNRIPLARLEALEVQVSRLGPVREPRRPPERSAPAKTAGAAKAPARKGGKAKGKG